MNRRRRQFCLGTAVAAALAAAGVARAATVAQFNFDTMADTTDTPAGERLFDASGNSFPLTRTFNAGTFHLSTDLPPVAPAGSLTLRQHGPPFVDTPASTQFSIGGQPGGFTAEFWWKPTVANTVNYIVMAPGSGAAARNQWGVYQGVPTEGKFAVKAFFYDDGPTGPSFFELSTGNIFDTDGFTPINPQWHHVGVTMDASKMGRLYLDGTEVASHSYAAANYQPWNTIMRTGANDSGGFTGGFYMDDLRISNVALPAGTGTGVNELAWNASLSAAPDPGPRPANLGNAWARSRPITITSWAGADDMNLVVGLNQNGSMTNRSGYHSSAAVGLNTQMLGSIQTFDEQTITELHIASNAPNLNAYMIRDEIPPEEIPAIAQAAAYIKSIDSSRIIIAGLGGSTPSYVHDVITQIQPDAVVHGFYPWQGPTPATDEFGFSLEDTQLVREEALEHNVPYFSYIQTFDDLVSSGNPLNDRRRLPSESELRAEVFSRLTAGVKGLVYFVVQAGTNEDNALVDKNGVPSALYAPAAAMNLEVARLGQSLTWLTSTDWRFVPGGTTPTPGAGQLGEVSNWSAGAGGDTHMTGITVNGPTALWRDGLIGVFADDAGQRHFMLQNLQHAPAGSTDDTTTSFTLTFDNSTNELFRLNRSTGGLELLLLNNHTLNLTLPGGTADLFKYDLSPFAGMALPKWNVNASGNWSASSNWSNGVPNAIGAAANLTDAINAARTVTVDAPQTVGFMFFANANPYTVTGTSPITLNVASGAAAISVTQGSHTISAPLTLAKDTVINVSPALATLNITEQMTVQPGVGVIKEGAGTARVKNVRAAALTVNAGTLAMNADSSAGGTSKVTALSVASGAKLDLSVNKLVTASAVGSWNGSAYTGVSGLVDSGRGNASNAQWNGSGIVTTDTRAVNNNDLVSIGTAKVGAIKNIADTATTTFAGQTVLGSDTLVMVTWGGDANLDGKINIDDYGQIDFNVGSSGSVFGWYNGDFNYDGKINIDDYGIIDFNVAAQTGQFPTGGDAGLDGVAAIPEPSLLMTVMGVLAGLRRRRNVNHLSSLYV